jgi:septal ring factor EnvC (AmiA/AmiB activator)
MSIDLEKIRRALKAAQKQDESVGKELADTIKLIDKLDTSLEKVASSLKVPEKHIGEIE